MSARALLALLATVASVVAAPPAGAMTTIYTATLSGPGESPPNASPAVGFAIVTLDDTSFTMRVQTVFAGLLGPDTAAHIHCCTAVPDTGTAGVATVTPAFPGFPLGVTAGTYDMTLDMTLASSWNPAYITASGGTTASAFTTLEGGLNSGKAYFNIHTTVVPGGEIRGFLAAAPVPEPKSYVLMLGGFAVVAWLARRRRDG